MNDLGELHYYLGVKFERNKEACTITIYQRGYIEEVFKRFNMEKGKPVGTPFDVNSKLLKLLDKEFENVQRDMEGIPNKAGVGSFIYTMVIMRAYIAFTVSTLSQFMLKAASTH